MTAPTTTPTLDVNALITAPEVHAALAAVLAEDIEWLDIAPSTTRTEYHGRESVLAMLAGLIDGGIETTILHGFAHGDRGAMSVRCTMPDGRVLLTNALLELRDGNITRWYGVEAWDA